jgi:Arc/MetJ-type ribon-helix-helix transcriptional regulator
VQLPAHLKEIVDRQVAAGRAASEADYVADALLAYSDHLDVSDDIAEMVQRADVDMGAGRFVTVSTPSDSHELHEAIMARLRERMAGDDPGQ